MNELTINLKSGGKAPLYEQIYLYIKKDIQNGKIPYGEKLPSTRALSKHLEVSRSTVELAYEQLLSEGYIEAKPYKGFFVAQIEGMYRLERVGVSEKQEEKLPDRKYCYDFTPNGVDLKSFLIIYGENYQEIFWWMIRRSFSEPQSTGGGRFPGSDL